MTEFERWVLILIGGLGGAVALVAAFAILSPQLPTRHVLQLLAGYEAPPILVAFVRRALTIASTAAVTWLANALGIVEEPASLATLAGSVAAAVEFLVWGMFDQLRKAHQNDRNPPAVAGSGGQSPVGGDATLLQP